MTRKYASNLLKFTLFSGLISMISMMVLLILTDNFWFALLPMTLMAYGTGVSRPILTSKLANSVQQSQTGTVLGVNNSLVSMVQIIAPSLGGSILEYGTSNLLVILSGLIYVILLIFWYQNHSNIRSEAEYLPFSNR